MDQALGPLLSHMQDTVTAPGLSLSLMETFPWRWSGWRAKQWMKTSLCLSFSIALCNSDLQITKILKKKKHRQREWNVANLKSSGTFWCIPEGGVVKQSEHRAGSQDTRSTLCHSFSIWQGAYACGNVPLFRRTREHGCHYSSWCYPKWNILEAWHPNVVVIWPAWLKTHVHTQWWEWV